MRIHKDLANINRESKSYKGVKISSYILFVLLLVIYFLSTVFTSRIASANGVIPIGPMKLPTSSFAGAVSSISSMVIIAIVVFYGRIGFYTGFCIFSVHIARLIAVLIIQDNITTVPGICSGLVTLIAIIVIFQRSVKVDSYRLTEIEHLKEQQKFSQRLFEQTATALVNAVDAKDEYSHGHSLRVAEYSEKIARAAGKSEDECYRIYYTALLHDVGKIGIDDGIINKNGKLDRAEYETIKTHPVIGNQILSSISEYPYLSIGAHYHHERYDGRGYPDHLKGDDIPEIARIIAVADAYDAMTSNRSYREAIPQQLVREELVKCSGTQFDPVFARIMTHLIDEDVDYQMKEKATVRELAGKNELRCANFMDEFSDGILIFHRMTTIKLRCSDYGEGGEAMPSLLVFDSLDGRIHTDEKTKKDLIFYEYAIVNLDGTYDNRGVRKIEVEESGGERKTGTRDYIIDTVKFDDHMLIMINDGSHKTKITLALPDSSRFVYVSLTGKNCRLSNVSINKAKEKIPKDYIKRIAEKKSYIDVPEGDIPNVQVDSHRTSNSEGILLDGKITLSFHTQSLPTARLVWHCPFIVIYASDDGQVRGENYREYALIRIDGENWNGDADAENKLATNRTDEFVDWDHWKKMNKEGIDCQVTFEREGDSVTVTTENLGIFVKNVTTVLDGSKKLYAALTGDQCAITNIKIIK